MEQSLSSRWEVIPDMYFLLCFLGLGPLLFKAESQYPGAVVFLDLLSKPILVKRVLRYNSGGSVYKPQMCRGKAVGYHTA